MADITDLKNRIRSSIKTNGNQEITGAVAQQILLDIADSLNAYLEAEATSRQSGDNTLQQGINTEKAQRQDVDSVLGQRITDEIRQEAQRAEEAFDSLDMIDAAGSALQSTQITLTLRKNDGSEQDPDWRTLAELVLPSATTLRAGLMSAADKTKLNSVEEGAEVNKVDAENTSSADLDFADENGNVLVEFENGHVRTKNFNSAEVTSFVRNEPQRVEDIFDSLDMIDAAGSALQSTQITLTLRKNNGSEQDPDWHTLAELILPSATTLRAGLMSAADKTKLNSVEEGAEVNKVDAENTSSTDLDFADENGNVLAEFENGHVRTKNFNSRKTPKIDSEDTSDFDISDENNNVLAEFKNGHVRTKNFDSSEDASPYKRGLMPAADKTKLNSIEEGAEVNKVDTEASGNSDVDVSDEKGNVIARFANGGFETKNYKKGYLSGLNLIQPSKIYTTCDDTIPNSAGNYWPRVTNVYLEHLIKISEKQECLFSNGKLTLPLVGRRMYLVEPSLGHYSENWMNNYFENVHIEQISEVIKGSYKDTPFTFSHICSKASLSKNKIIPVLQIGDSVTEGSNSECNKEHNSDPNQSWAWLKYFFEFDNSKDSGNRKVFTVGQHNKSTFVLNNVSVDNYAEGRSGWTTAMFLKTKNFSEGNSFYDSNKSYQDADLSSYGVKFSIAKWLERYRTMDDSGNRLSGSAGQTVTGLDGKTYTIGTEVTNLSAYDVCTPKVIILQLGFNDNVNTFVSDMSLMLKAIKEEYPDMIIGISIIDASGAYYPEKWDGWDSQAKDISFLQPIDYSEGNGYNKRLHEKVFNHYTGLAAFEDNENGIYVINNNAIQPSAFSVPCVISKEPGLFGRETYHPMATNSYAYHPNNQAHACWGYQLYSWINYLSNIL